jgi:hypothetical protein
MQHTVISGADMTSHWCVSLVAYATSIRLRTALPTVRIRLRPGVATATLRLKSTPLRPNITA